MVTVVIVALGVAVPLAIGVVNSNDHATNAPGGVDLNAAQTNGRAVFGKYCATCHTLKASNAVGKVGPNLDVLHPPKGLILDAIANGRARGQGQMPAGLVDGAGRPGRGGLRRRRRRPRIASRAAAPRTAADRGVRRNRARCSRYVGGKSSCQRGRRVLE